MGSSKESLKNEALAANAFGSRELHPTSETASTQVTDGIQRRTQVMSLTRDQTIVHRSVRWPRREVAWDD